MRRFGPYVCLLAFGCLLGGAAGSGARPLQDEPGKGRRKKAAEEKNEIIEREVSRALPGGEAQALIERILDGMKEVDENLLSASARGVPEQMEANARYMEELLGRTREKSRQVIRDLDELIRNIKYRKQPSGNGGQCDTPPREGQGEEPRNRPRADRREEGLKKNPAAGKKDEEKSGGKKGEGKPTDRKPGKDKGNPPPPKPPEKVRHPDLSGRWGVLPPKIQKEILNFNIENFPEKYRKWLEEYYRRVNRRPGR